MSTIAIMQPYFFPYGGYYRLLAEADIFVLLDCVQFPRRGRVHRSALPGPGRWLTLPVVPSDRTALIREIRLAPDAPERLRRQIERHRLLEPRDTPLRREIAELLARPRGLLADYVADSLKIVSRALGYDCKFLRSSALDVPAEFRGQERILEISRRLEAVRYINSPGGRSLYQPEAFAAAGLDLCFLSDYSGQLHHFLPALFTWPLERIRADIATSRGFAGPAPNAFH